MVEGTLTTLAESLDSVLVLVLRGVWLLRGERSVGRTVRPPYAECMPSKYNHWVLCESEELHAIEQHTRPTPSSHQLSAELCECLGQLSCDKGASHGNSDVALQRLGLYGCLREGFGSPVPKPQVVRYVLDHSYSRVG